MDNNGYEDAQSTNSQSRLVNNGADYASQPSMGGGSDILQQCTDIDRTITELESRLQGLRSLQSRILADRAPISDLDNESTDLMSTYRNLAARMKKIKSNPESGAPRNAPQVGRVDRRLKSAMNDFQRLESEFRGQMRDQQARQYRIVNPNATEEEVQQVIEDPNTQVFQQAVSRSQARQQIQTTNAPRS